MHYFDAHTHLQFSAFKEDSEEAVQRAFDKGVAMINVGTQRDTSSAAVLLAREYPRHVYAAVGLHPIHTEQSHHDTKELGSDQVHGAFTSRGEVFDDAYYRELARDPKVVAIGECGLDYYRLSEETKEKQAQALVAQIELAQEVKKPLMIHCRNAFHDLIPLLRAHVSSRQSPGVIHFFSGTKEDASTLLDMGYVFTFGGVITFARDYDEVIRMIPAKNILSETDAPYVTPEPFRGKRNEAANVVYVVRKLAEIRGISEEAMRECILENAKRVFSIV